MTDIFVFGRIAGNQAARVVRSKGSGSVSKGLAEKAIQLELEVRKIMTGDTKAPLRPSTIRSRVEEIMFRHVGFGRDKDGLEQALSELGRIKAEDLPRARPASNAPRFNMDLIQTLELANMIDIGRAVARAALERTETRGCHNRLDFPRQDDRDWLVHLLVTQQGGGLKVDKTPVVAD
jgi:succinate dehydrogenase/fumarate reductase flavoprotein subunit